MKNFRPFSILVFVLLLLSGKNTRAQETDVFHSPQLNYAEAFSLFQLEKYGDALVAFENLIDHQNENNISELDLLNAKYYEAVCSEKLNLPVAETEFINLIADNPGTVQSRLASFHLGNIYYQQKKYDKAINWYSKTDPFDLDETEKADYKFRFGYCYFSKKEFEKALPYFIQTKDVKTAYYYPANYYYAYISYSNKNYDDALRSFKVLEGSDLYQAVLPYYLSNIYFLQKKYQAVIDYTEPKLKDQTLSYRPELAQLVGKSYYNLGNYSTALPLLSAWLKNAATNTKSDIYQLAVCQYMTGNYADASFNFLQLNALQDSLGQNAIYMLGNCYLKSNQKEKARTAFSEASKFNFDKTVQENASFNFAKLNVELGYNDLAISSLQTFITSFPKSTHSNEVKELLTTVFLNTNNYKAALDVIETINPKSAEIKTAYQRVAFARGIQLYQDENVNGAQKLFDESLLNTIDPTITAQCYYWKAEAFFEKKFYNEAIKNDLKFLDLAKQQLKLPATVNVASANYTLGYCYYKLQNYQLAQSYFDNARLMFSTPTTNQEIKLQNENLLADDLLRLGDCNFILKQYDKALTNYATVSDKNGSGSDYALYQTAIILGLQNNLDDKLTTLKSITTNFANSIYADDALYETGNTYLLHAQYDDAVISFKKLIHDFDQSPFVPKSYNKLGLIYFNQSKNDLALSSYQTVLTNFPQSGEVPDAVKGLKEIYIDKGDPQGFLNLMQGIPNINITAQETDSLLYRSSENLYVKGDCNAAVQSFNDYLQQFPQGAFAIEAHFYRAECLYKNANYNDALADYQIVNAASNNRFTEKSLLQAARIYYTNKNYQQAYDAYDKLIDVASFKSNAFEALQGKMYCAWNLNQSENVTEAAQKIIVDELSSAGDVLQAHYYLGKVYLAEKKFSLAKEEFNKVAIANQGDISAESNYELAHIEYLNSDSAAAIKQCESIFNNPPSNNYWLAKTYLLVARIQYEGGDYFQARSTLQSIIDNYTETDDILPEANELLQKVQDDEASQSKLMDENLNQPLNMDSIPQPEIKNQLP